MKLTDANGRDTKGQRELPRPVAAPDSFTLRQLEEAMKWLRATKRERKLTHASNPAR